MSNNQENIIEWFYESIKQHLTETQLLHLEVIYSNIKVMREKELNQFRDRLAKNREQTQETYTHIGFARGFECGLQCFDDYYQELDKTNLDESEFTRNYITDRFEETYKGDKQKDFEVFCLETISQGDSMYTHWSKGLTMYVIKDGVTIRLNSEEIQHLVKSLPRTIGGTY